MPTTRPRHQITETPSVAHALDLAAQQWPTEPRSRLLLRLIDAGARHLADEHSAARRSQIEAITASARKYADVFGSDYLAQLRQDWPA